MAASTRAIFRTSILVSGLLDEKGLKLAEEAVRSELSDTSDTPEIPAEILAEKLVELDLLTPYQVKQLQGGRTKLDLGPYIITDFIGQGGMGQVFKAEHKMMGRVTAIKVLPLNKATPEAISSFTREIRTQAQLDHPNLVRAHDAGHDGHVHYLVTEYVPGTDLRRLVRRQGPLTIKQAASVAMQAALGLEYAHQRDLIHRDIKPGNLLVTPTGHVKVSDLGLSAFMNKVDEDPRAGKIVGTADYLSPEQIRTPLNVTAVSDIYSLGCSLYYAVTGKVPFPGGTAAEKTRRHVQETPWHPRRFNPDLSEEFVEIIADMMEKEPANRIASAAEVAARLETWAGDVSVVPSQGLSKSPWTPPPLPTADIMDELEETNEGLDVSASESVSLSQTSQGTSSLAASDQDTHSLRNTSQPPQPPPLPASQTASEHRQTMAAFNTLVIALAIAIPASVLIGVLIGFFVARFMT